MAYDLIKYIVKNTIINIEKILVELTHNFKKKNSVVVGGYLTTFTITAKATKGATEN